MRLVHALSRSGWPRVRASGQVLIESPAFLRSRLQETLQDRL